MKQSQLMSAVEVVCNIGSGVLISWVVTLYVIPWLLGVEIDYGRALGLTAIYTTISLVRSYLWRRIFNGR